MCVATQCLEHICAPQINTLCRGQTCAALDIDDDITTIRNSTGQVDRM